MTRKEQTGVRDLTLSGWVREHLPDSSSGFMVSDLDFIFWNYKTRNLMLLEAKTRGSFPRPWQRNIFSMLDRMIRYAVQTMPEFKMVTYHGFHVLTFQNTFFDDGEAYIDGQLSSEEDVRIFLSMEAHH